MSLREHYDRYVGAAMACELIYYWLRDYDADSNIFDLLLWTLQSIDNGNSPQTVQIFFQIKLYTLLGYKLHLSGCIRCGIAEKDGKPYVFHPARHGLLCRKCSSTPVSRETVKLAMNTIKLLQHAQGLPIDKLMRLRFSDSSTREALHLFKVYGQYLLQREIKAWGFLEKSCSKRENSNPDR
jgi:DNA repair protein RecO (recombination protein O)